MFELRVGVALLGVCTTSRFWLHNDNYYCIIILLRFLSDKHRLNVAITRSKRALYVLGHLKSLKVQYNYSQCPCIVVLYYDDLLFQVNDHWKALINHAQSCNAVIPVKGSHSAVVNRILKTRHLKTQVDVGDHHKSGSSRDQQFIDKEKGIDQILKLIGSIKSH